MRWFSDELFFPKFDPSRASILELVRLFLNGRAAAHACVRGFVSKPLTKDTAAGLVRLIGPQ